MFLTAGVLCVTISVLWFMLVLIGARNPANPKWCSDGWLSNFHVPMMVLFGVVGLSSIAQFAAKYSSQSLSMSSAAASVLIVIAGFIAGKSLKVRKRLQEFEARKGKADVIYLQDRLAGGSPEPGPSEQPTDGTRKAA